MNTQQILDQSHALGLVALTVTEEYPQLKRQVRDGLLLAVAGKVERVNEWYWRVKGHTIIIEGSPRRWSCDCPQGQDYGPVVSFMGWPGRICKHCVSVALVQASAVTDPPLLPRPASIMKLVMRMAQVPLKALFNDGDVVLPTGLPTDIKLALVDDVLVLKAGRAFSGALADIVEGRARMSPAAITNYAHFYANIQARGIVPQPALQVLEVQP